MQKGIQENEILKAHFKALTGQCDFLGPVTCYLFICSRLQEQNWATKLGALKCAGFKNVPLLPHLVIVK